MSSSERFTVPPNDQIPTVEIADTHIDRCLTQVAQIDATLLDRSDAVREGCLDPSDYRAWRVRALEARQTAVGNLVRLRYRRHELTSREKGPDTAKATEAALASLRDAHAKLIQGHREALERNRLIHGRNEGLFYALRVVRRQMGPAAMTRLLREHGIQSRTDYTPRPPDPPPRGDRPEPTQFYLATFEEGVRGITIAVAPLPDALGGWVAWAQTAPGEEIQAHGTTFGGGALATAFTLVWKYIARHGAKFQALEALPAGPA